MKRSLFSCLLLLVFAVGVPAQNPEAPGPPDVVMIVREDIKPGMMAAHNKHSAAYASLFAKLQTPNHRIALLPVAGNENEVLYVTPARSFADLETINKGTDAIMTKVSGSVQTEVDRLDKEASSLHSAMRDIIAVYRPELSYNPGVSLPTMRYMAVTTVRVRPGQDQVFMDYVQNLLNKAREKAKGELHIAAFSVVAGAPGSTYMFFRPMKSLAEYDQRLASRVRAAMTEDQRTKGDKMQAESVMSSESSIYAMAPGMSYVAKEFAAVDPGFWLPKPAVAAKPKPKKKVTPAAPGGQQ